MLFVVVLSRSSFRAALGGSAGGDAVTFRCQSPGSSCSDQVLGCSGW